MASGKEKALSHDHSRLRVFGFVELFIAIGLAGQMNEESDAFLHALDEYALVALSITVVIPVVAWRKKQTLAHLGKQLTIFKIMQEIGEPIDFRNWPQC